MRKKRLYKHICLIGAALFATVFAIVSIANWRSPGLTYSQHIALNGWSIILFAVSNTIVAICLGISLLYYIKPRWKFSRYFTVTSLFFVTALLLEGWFPHLAQSNSISAIIHQTAAAVMFVSSFVLVSMVTIFYWKRSNMVIKTAGSFIMSFGIVSIIIMLFFSGAFLSEVFFIEIGYLFSVLIFILIINYSKPKHKKLFTR